MRTAILSAILLVNLVMMTTPLPAHSPESDELMVRAAGNFLASLDSAQRTKCVFPFSQEEWESWHFIPMRSRIGLPYSEMEPHQVRLADALVASGLSRSGYYKTKTIMSLEHLLLELEKAAGRNDEMLTLRNPDLYFFAFYGDPNRDQLWGWRVEGHHISFHFTVDRGQIRATTPMFMGANPHQVLAGPHRGLRALGKEEDLARALIDSLDAGQRDQAVLGEEAPADIFTSNARSAEFSVVPAKGLSRSAMNARQKELLQALIDEYIHNVPPDLAAARTRRVRDSGDEIYFAWMGSLEKGPGHAHYYRVHGKTFLIEYDNIQNNANHSHSVWRDYENDFGRDWIAEHYRQDH
jgi:hypothetical protein